MNYLVLLEGKGFGCDYTIGCNKTWFFLDATTKEQARSEVEDMIRKDYRGERSLEKVEIIEANSIDDFHVSNFYAHLKFEKEIRDKITEEENEKKRYEELKKKFG